MTLQQFCYDNRENILNDIQEYLDNDVLQQKLNKEKVGTMIDNWLKEFKITQPRYCFLH